MVVHLCFFFNASSVFIFYFIQTREASSSSSWLVSELTEWLLDALGALMGKGGCRDMVACRWHFYQHQVITIYFLAPVSLSQLSLFTSARRSIRPIPILLYHHGAKSVSDVSFRTGRLLQDKLPGSQVGGFQVLPQYADGNFQVLAMLGESLVPKPARHFFNVVSANK